MDFPHVVCKNCGHSKEKHNGNTCSQNPILFAQHCTCNNFIEIQISTMQELQKEFNEAYQADRDYLESTKNSDGFYQISNIGEAILIHERQTYLWKQLINRPI